MIGGVRLPRLSRHSSNVCRCDPKVESVGRARIVVHRPLPSDGEESIDAYIAELEEAVGG